MILEDLLDLPSRELLRLMRDGHPLDPEALVGWSYLGVDLSLPPVANRLLWKTFRKTFVRAEDGSVRGWNERMQQHGIRGLREPMRNRRGEPLTFGHYRVRAAAGRRWPLGWRGSHYLDYGVAGNALYDPARFGFAPLVAVNAGDMHLLLGWEVFKVGPALVPIPDFWALEREDPVERVVAPPR